MPLYNWTKNSFFYHFFFVKNLIFICGLLINFFVEKTSKFVIFFDQFVIFGAVFWQNSRKSHINFFFRNLYKKCQNLHQYTDFCVFYPLLLKKCPTHEISILYFFKDRNVLNIYLHVIRLVEGTLRFSLNFEVHFLENRFPNLFRKTTRFCSHIT